jgi:glycosyltransferase involved in cell wall biosynthesis
MSNCLVDSRWEGDHGIGRYAIEIIKRLPNVNRIPNSVKKLSALDPFWLSYQIHKSRAGCYYSPGYNPPIRSSCPFIFTIHDLFGLDKKDPESSRMRRIYFNKIIKPAVYKAHKVVTVSEFSKQKILVWLPDVSPDKIEVVHNASVFSGNTFDSLELNKWNPGFRYCLYIGNYRHHKNLDGLIKSFSLVKDKELKLLISGKGNEHLKYLVKQCDLEKRVVFTGFIENKDLLKYYSNSEVVVVPSFCEGFGLPALEAMSCGAPVISSNLGALPEVVGDAGVYIDPYSLSSIAEAIDKVVSSCKLQDDLRLRGFDQARKFSFGLSAGKICSLIERI